MLGAMFTDVRHFPSIDSTNRYLLDEARAGAEEGVVAVAQGHSCRGERAQQNPVQHWAMPRSGNDQDRAPALGLKGIGGDSLG